MKKDVAFVGIQIGLFSVYVFNVDFYKIVINETLTQVGLVGTVIGVLIIIIAILQLNTNLSPFPTPKVDGSLIKNGLYALVRHPIYTGIILGSFSYGVFRSSIWKLLVSAALLLLFHFKAKYEEYLLIFRFREEYEMYMKNSGRFFPKLMLYLWKKK